jgi:heat shock protein HslJ
MACPNTLDVERRIHEMFSNVTGWKISGETLQLTNANGDPIATFESRYMR